MTILWLTRKDRAHPDAGGAEVVSYNLRQRLCADGHEVTLLTSDYPGANAAQSEPNIATIRVGSNRYLHPLVGALYYVRHLRNKFDIVIEEINAAPYMSVLLGRRSRRFLFYHHLERKVWLYEAAPPINLLCYCALEPIATWLLSRAHVPLITVSESTRQEMARFGFSPQKTHIISEGINLSPVADLQQIKKYSQPTILSLGGMRPMKRTLDQVRAFELAKPHIPNLKLKIAGNADGKYGRTVLQYLAHSLYADDITFLGHVTETEKAKLMQRCHIILATSVKEGWGLVITEAASQGTPAVAYDVPGLRDSVVNGVTGSLTDSCPQALALEIVKLLHDPITYERLRHAAWHRSKRINFEQSYQDFKRVIRLS